MKRALMGAAALALVWGCGVGAQDNDLHNAVADDYTGHLEALYLHLHQNPELSFQETETATLIASELRDLGFAVTEGVGQTGLFGVLENGEGPTVLIRTDLDALPVHEQTGLDYASTAMGVTRAGADSYVMHACGHDVHMTSFIGTARRLAAMKDDWSGTLVMIGQPAEEIGLGAKAMLDDGLYSRIPMPDYNLALHVSASHPAGLIAYTPGWALANVDSVDIEIPGVGGHGAYPHTTKDPIVLSAYIVTALQTLVSRETSPLDSAVVTVGSIHGGAKHNIIPDGVHLQLTVRSYSDETRDRLLSGIARIARAQAEAFGMPEELYPTITVEDPYTPSTYNDPALSARVATAMRGQLGAEQVIESDPVMGGEDFSQYGRTEENIPGIIFWVGAVDPARYAEAQANGETLPSLHSSLFAPAPEATITTGVEAMTSAALALFGDES